MVEAGGHSIEVNDVSDATKGPNGREQKLLQSQTATSAMKTSDQKISNVASIVQVGRDAQHYCVERRLADPQP